MMTGVSPGEIIIIVLLLIMAFDRKEIVSLIRTFGKAKAQLQNYNQTIKASIRDIAAIDAPPPELFMPQQRQLLRTPIINWRRSVSAANRTTASDAIRNHLLSSAVLASSRSVLVYLNMGAEVETRALVGELLRSGKRVVLPYVRVYSDESDTGSPMGIGEVLSVEADTLMGHKGFMQPRPELWGNFLWCDVDLVLCPIVVFDRACRAIFRENSLWDACLAEVKGRRPIWGVAYTGQQSESPIRPELSEFELDNVVTETGFVKRV